MNIAKNIELRPCPFCGGEAILVKNDFACSVRCTKCGAETRDAETCMGLYTTYYAIINEAAELWNKRAGESE
jgi:hypothetical protein